MKRFRELVIAARRNLLTDDFFADFETSCYLEPQKANYRSYDDALMLLDDESWKILKEKAIKHYLNERPGQRKEGFFNQLNEAFAYRYLLRRRFQGVRLVKEAKHKTPDILFFNRGVEGYCEVKTVGISNDEIERRYGNPVRNSADYLNLSPGLMNKLESDIDQGWKQINSLGEVGIVFILMRLDDMALDYYSQNRKQLVEFLRNRGLKNTTIKIGHRGRRRISV